MLRSRFLLVSTLFLVAFTTVLITAPASALGPRAIRLMLGGSSMGQSFDYKRDLDLVDSDRSLWMTGGVSLEIGLFGDSPLDLEVGAMYIQKGMQTDIKFYDETGTYLGKITLDPSARYLSIPVLLRFTLIRGTLSPYVVAGPTLEIRLSEDGKIVFDEIYDRMDTANLGIQAGVGAEFGNIGASVRYIRDLNTTLDAPADWNLESVTNDGILALVTFRLW